MDWSLIAWGLPDLSSVGYILQVVFGLGMVIFVHELGHFAVAKACGVKCEKFYLGFDIAGLKIWKCQWGETEYGIGILPLGGYVKMLGQEDNPAKLQEEIERAKQATKAQPTCDAAKAQPTCDAAKAQPTCDAAKAQPTCDATDPGPCCCGTKPADNAPSATDNVPSATDLAAANEALYNPRSFLAKSVPQRMAIISAGVIMNLLFAIITGTIAYSMGIFHMRCGVGGVAPGSSAWQNQLEAGDRIVAIDGKRVERFEDLLYKVTVGDVENGVDLEIERPGVKAPFPKRVIPNPTKPAPTIGIAPPRTTSLSPKLPTMPGSAAAWTSVAFAGGDKVVAIDGRTVSSFADVAESFAGNPSKTLRLTVQRTPKTPEGAAAEKAEAKPTLLSIDLPPVPRKTLGIVMPMGPITVIQKDSPAEQAGLKPGDVIVAVDNRPNPDATFFPDQMQRLAEQKKTVRLSVQRPGRKEPMVVELSPKVSRLWILPPQQTFASPMAASAVGIAYFIPNRIASIERGSPAAAAGIESDQTILSATLKPPEESDYERLGLTPYLNDLDLSDISADFQKPGVQWSAFAQLMDHCVQGYRVELTLQSGKVTLDPVDAKDAFQVDRGLMFSPDGFRLQASSTLHAITLGTEATWEATTLVFRFLRKLPSRLRAVGGPLTILQGAYYKATSGWSDFLMFLTLIGANLAVINFLPIPLLDGGHMIFLAYEGIARKPPNERVQLILSYVGLLLLLTLMVWAFGLDLGLISRH